MPTQILADEVTSYHPSIRTVMHRDAHGIHPAPGTPLPWGYVPATPFAWGVCSSSAPGPRHGCGLALCAGPRFYYGDYNDGYWIAPSCAAAVGIVVVGCDCPGRG